MRPSNPCSVSEASVTVAGRISKTQQPRNPPLRVELNKKEAASHDTASFVIIVSDRV